MGRLASFNDVGATSSELMDIFDFSEIGRSVAWHEDRKHVEDQTNLKTARCSDNTDTHEEQSLFGRLSKQYISLVDSVSTCSNQWRFCSQSRSNFEHSHGPGFS